MKLMVSVTLLVAISHAALASARSRQEEEEHIARRQLQEGNYGLKVQPSNFQYSQHAADSRFRVQGGPPQTEYGPPRQPVAKISDVLTGQGPSFPDAIRSHLFSPVQIYQPRLGAPTTFEVSRPIASQLAYAEHKIYQGGQTIQSINENLQSLSRNQNNQLLAQPQPPPVRFNPYQAFGQLQPPNVPQPTLSNNFLPQIHPRFQIPQQLYQQMFPENSGVIPQNFYQQINQLQPLTNSNQQISYEESIQLSNGDANENENKDSGIVKEQTQKPGIQYESSSRDQNQKIEEQSQTSTEQYKSSSTQQQAVSYASFSQSLPETSQNQISSLVTQQSLSSPSPLPQRQELPKPQPPPLFQPTRARSQSTISDFASQSEATTPSSRPTLFTAADNAPLRIGLVSIRQDFATPQPQTLQNLEAQSSSESSIINTAGSVSLSTVEQAETTSFTTPVPTTQPRFTIRTRPTFLPRTSPQTTTRKVQSNFRPRLTLPPLPPLPRRTPTTIQTLSTLAPTFPTQALTQTQPTLSPISILQPASTLSPISDVQTLQPVTNVAQNVQTLQPLRQLTTLQPLPTLSTVPTNPQPGTLISTPIVVQQFGIQPTPPTVVQFQQYETERRSEQQLSQQPQQQLLQEQLPIQQQLLNIQQELQLLRQQPQLIQQQPQPVQIVQQQPVQTPQNIQLVQNVPQPVLLTSQPQPTQLVQNIPQPIQTTQPEPTQLIEQRPQQIQTIEQRQQSVASSQTQTESKGTVQQEQKEKEQNSHNDAKTETQEENAVSQETEENYYLPLLHNNVFPGASPLFVPPVHLQAVPVGFPSFEAVPSFPGAPAAHAAPSFHAANIFHSPAPYPAVHNFAKFHNGILRTWR